MDCMSGLGWIKWVESRLNLKLKILELSRYTVLAN